MTFDENFYVIESHSYIKNVPTFLSLDFLKDLKMLHRLIKFADKEIAKQNAKTEILIDQFNNSKKTTQQN